MSEQEIVEAPGKKRIRRSLKYFEPMFTKKSVDETRCPLLKLIKLICTRLGITNEEFAAKHLDWYTSGNGKGTKSPVHTSLNNIRSGIVDKLTTSLELFRKVVYGVLNLQVKDLSCTIVHPFTKEEITIKSSSTYDEQRKLREEERKKVNIIS